MKLHPLEDRIVVRPNTAEATTASGLVIPDTAKEKTQQGEVLATGPGRIERVRRDSLDLSGSPDGTGERWHSDAPSAKLAVVSFEC